MTLASQQSPAALPQDPGLDREMTSRWTLRRGLLAVVVAGLIGWVALVQFAMTLASALD